MGSSFSIFGQFLRQEELIGYQKNLRGCSSMAGTDWRNSPSRPNEIVHFLVLALFFHPSFPNFGHSKAIFLNRS